MTAYSVGVDWAAGKWLSISYSQTNEYSAAVYDDITELWKAVGSQASRVLIDIPIGLCNSFESDDGCVEIDGKLYRECDKIARSLLGPRSASVFDPPARSAAELAMTDVEHKEVSKENVARTGKGVSVQAANIANGIITVDTLLQETNATDRILESHPEVCFRAFAGEPLQHYKKTAPGVLERLSVLESVPEYEREDWRIIAEALEGYDERIAVDDLLDATVLALTAAAPSTELHTIPTSPPPDCTGIPMQMVYRRKTPFSQSEA